MGGWMGGWWIGGWMYLQGSRADSLKKSTGIPSWELSSNWKKKKVRMVKILFHFPQAKEKPTLCNRLVNSCWHFLPSASHYDMMSPEKLLQAWEAILLALWSPKMKVIKFVLKIMIPRSLYPDIYKGTRPILENKLGRWKDVPQRLPMQGNAH